MRELMKVIAAIKLVNENTICKEHSVDINWANI